MLKFKKLITMLIETFLELLFPEKGICFICDNYDEDIGDDHICSECREKVVYIGSHKCSVCGRPLELGYIPDKCPECINHPHYFVKAISPLEYSGIIRDAIHKYKYNKKHYMYKLFGPFLVQAIKEDGLEGIDLIVPVPLHSSKMSERGFNQSELLGKYISKKLNIPLDSKNLVRFKKTAVQNKLDKAERKKNVRNAFKAVDGEAFRGKRILLIDDVFTTGATVDECSKVLLKEGAKDVFVLTIARGTP